MERFEIDQSGRVDQAGDTFLALTNGISLVLKFSFKVKEVGRQVLQTRGASSKLIHPLLWSACLFLLIENFIQKYPFASLTIDNEFDGHQGTIKASLLRHLTKNFHKPNRWLIRVASIGKKSKAHINALATKRGKAIVSEVRSVSAEELRKVLASS